MKSLFSALIFLLSVSVWAGPMNGGANCQHIVTISRGEVYLDGGSLRIDGLDRCLQEFSLKVDNSLEREREVGYPKFVLNGTEIERSSDLERQLLGILDRAVSRRISPLSIKKFKERMADDFDNEEARNTAVLMGAMEYLCQRQQRENPRPPCTKYLS